MAPLPVAAFGLVIARAFVAMVITTTTITVVPFFTNNARKE